MGSGAVLHLHLGWYYFRIVWALCTEFLFWVSGFYPCPHLRKSCVPGVLCIMKLSFHVCKLYIIIQNKLYLKLNLAKRELNWKDLYQKDLYQATLSIGKLADKGVYTPTHTPCACHCHRVSQGGGAGREPGFRKRRNQTGWTNHCQPWGQHRLWGGGWSQTKRGLDCGANETF